jgi:hypothetical protein
MPLEILLYHRFFSKPKTTKTQSKLDDFKRAKWKK